MKRLVSTTARYASGLVLIGIGLGLGFAQFILNMQLPWTVGVWIGFVTVLLTTIGVLLGLSGALPKLMEDFNTNGVDTDSSDSEDSTHTDN